VRMAPRMVLKGRENERKNPLKKHGLKKLTLRLVQKRGGTTKKRLGLQGKKEPLSKKVLKESQTYKTD